MKTLDPLGTLPQINLDLADPVSIKGRRARRYKIAWVLTAMLLLVGILPVYTVSSRLIELNKESLKTQQQVNQLQLASSLAHHIDTYIDGQGRTVAVLAEVLSSELNKSASAHSLPDLTRRGTLSRFIDEGMILIRYTHRDGQSATAMEEGFEANQEIETRLVDHFARQMNTGIHAQTEVGEPFFYEPENGPVVFLSTPVVRGGRRVGVLSSLVSLSILWHEAQRSSGYSLFALDSHGHLFTEPKKSSSFAGVPYSDLEIVREFRATGGSRVMPYTARDSQDHKVSLLGSYHQTRHGWGVFVQAEETQAYSFVEIMKWNTWFHAGMAAIGALLLGLLFAVWISRPIRELADSSLAFAEGDFHARVMVRSGNEMGELAETFNAMAETLERYIARLKHAALENSQLFLGSIRALAAAIDEKDAYTRGHSERVRGYAARLARYLKLPREEIWKTEVGALLHDVGKIGIQDCILNKPGPLTSEEYEIMKTHPTKGANIMSPIQQLSDVVPVMKHHHERWDGDGYPEGLAREEIPFCARIVTIADCWDAMTTNRPYQKAMSLEEGTKRLRTLAGRVFDPKIAGAFIAGLEAGEYREVFGDARRQVEATEGELRKVQLDVQTVVSARENHDPDCLPPVRDRITS
ncbi:MAG: HD domain-containing phosphohydrolase [Acidobacteriota bacterium]